MQAKSDPKLYFEKQGTLSLQCGLHAVNNLLGRQQFTKNNFNDICNQLQKQSNQSYQYPIIGGDYDVSVLISALHKINFEVEWHDTRKKFQKNQLQRKQNSNLQGYLVNIKSPQKFYHRWLKFSGRHWISLKISQDHSKIQLMDSLQQEASLLNQQQLDEYLEKERQNGSQILLVFTEKKNLTLPVEKSWLND